MNHWFTSDTHYGHANIIGYSNRPYDSVIEMREDFITNWNAVVRPGDLVYHLGDFAFTKPEEAVKILNRLNGQKYLVWGNHDKRLRKEKDFMEKWVWCKDLTEISIGDQKIVLCHYPMLTWNKSHRGSWNLHGHCHGSLKPDPHSLRVDVGVDCFDYYPVHFEELQKIMSKKTYQPVDHHGARKCEDCPGESCDTCHGSGVV
jgi:calcineurin-like phosphoesterase family protein